MKSVAIAIFVLLVIAVLGLSLFSFQVRETESALVLTFDNPSEEPITEPGWYFKWPPPIQTVEKYDTRLKVFEADLAETTTKGAVPIIVKTYVVWKIAEPLDFRNSVRTVEEAENKLHSQLNDTQNSVIGQFSFSEFVNSDVSQIKIVDVQAKMLEILKQTARKDYGIEVVDLGIKQLKIAADTTKDVFERMRAERIQMTEKTKAEGEAQKVKIETEADSMRTELLSAADARAKAMMGKGDAEAAQYYKMLDDDPELAMFLRSIEAFKKILDKRATFVISADEEPFRLLKKIPFLVPKE